MEVMTNPNILIVEDDKNTGFLLAENLRMTGFDPDLARDGVEGLEKFCSRDFDLCILDIMLPKKDGLQLARNIRKKDPNVPIIFLSARALSEDRIEGFETGCDDYVTKPFNTNELIWRIKAILKRTGHDKENSGPSEYQLGRFIFNPLDRSLISGKVHYKLSGKESSLLQILCEAKGRSLSRQVILERVWGRDDFFTSKSLDVYLTKIRKILREDETLMLQNIHGYGYKLIDRRQAS